MISQSAYLTTAAGERVIPVSGAIHIEVGATLRLPLDDIFFLIEELRQANTFSNPQFTQARKRGYWTGNISKSIKLYRIENDQLYLPRGFYSKLTELLRERGLEYQVEDCTVCPGNDDLIEIRGKVRGQLYDYQDVALKALLRRYTGVLEAPPGSGKTHILLSSIAELKTTSLILVHTQELLAQTAERCRQWLGIDPGIIGGGEFELRPITVGMIQTLARRDLKAEGIADYFGCVMVDECHHSPALTWAKILQQLPARYKYGFTATGWRKDGLQFLMWKLIGNKTAQISREEVEAAGRIIWPGVETVTTDYSYDLENSDQWGRMITDLVRDQARNRLIAREVRRRLKPGSKMLILSDRIKHVNLLAKLLQDLDPVVLTGALLKSQREAAMVRVRGGARLTIATSGLLGEGVDVPGWDLLLLASPFAGGPRTLQAAGRVARPAKGKRQATVVDFVDVKIPALRAAWRKRQALYAA